MQAAIVRLHSAAQQCEGGIRLAQTQPLPVKKRAVPGGCAPLRLAETRQYWSKSRKPALLSLSGNIPVPQCRRSGRRECHADPNEGESSPA